jgi:hypothetical protein
VAFRTVISQLFLIGDNQLSSGEIIIRLAAPLSKSKKVTKMMIKRILYAIALTSLFSISGCGSSGDSVDGSGSGSGPLNVASTLPAEQQAQIGLQVNVASSMNVPGAWDAVEQQQGEVPAFVKAAKNFSIFVNLPSSMPQDPSSINFAATLEFATEGDATSAMDEATKTMELTDTDLNGKSFKILKQPGSPTVYFSQNGESITARSEAFAKFDATSFASDDLRSLLNSFPDSDDYKLAIDMKGAKGLMGELSGMAEAVPVYGGLIKNILKMNSLQISGGMGENIFSMMMDSPDDETLKSVEKDLSNALKFLPLMMEGTLPDEEEAPATNKMYQHVMDNLTPVVDGKSIKIVISKPEGFEEMLKEVAKETEKMAPQGGASPFPPANK